MVKENPPPEHSPKLSVISNAEVNPESSAEWQRELFKILKNKWVLIGLLVTTSLVSTRLFFNWWSLRRSALPVVTVQAVHPILRNVDKTLSLPGNIEAIEQATLYAHVSGYLKKIYVDEGDKVKKGQLLAEIDAPDIVQEFRKAKAEYDFKETTRRRYAALLKDQVVSQQEFDTINSDAEESQARFQNAQANLDYTFVRAPFTGSIARRMRYPGDFISAASHGGSPSPIFVLVNEGTLRIVVNLPQKEMGNIGVGHPVDIRVDTFPDRTFPGKISRIDALLDDSTKTQRVLIDIDNPEVKLRAGMFASVVLHIERTNNALTVPTDTVYGDGSDQYVFKIENLKLKKIPVTSSTVDDSTLAIAGDGLSPDILLARGTKGLLSDGIDVRVANTTETKKE